MPGLLCWLAAITVLLGGCVSSQTPTRRPASPPTSARAPLPPEVVWTVGVARESYEALVARAKARDAMLDFRELRAAYAELPLDQRKGGLRGAPLLKEMLDALQQQEPDRALDRAHALMALCYVDIDAHAVASIAYRQNADLDRANFHRWILDGLVRSILDSGDGKSPETAMEVIGVGEEYALFRILGLQSRGQALIRQAGHFYDAMQLVNPRTKEAFTWHFNVDVSLREAGEMMRSGTK